MKDLVSGIGVSALGILIVFMARQMRSPLPGFGPEFFPSAIGILLAIFGGLLALQGFPGKWETDKDDNTRQAWIVMFTLALTAGYIAGLLWIPFLISTPVYLMALSLMGKSTKEGGLQKRFYPRIVAFALIISGMVYVVFRYIFRVALI